MEEQVKAVLVKVGRLNVDATTIASDADLYELGLTSHASVNVMLALEDEFDVEFPDSVLTKATFSSVANLAAVVAALTGEAA